MIPSRKIFSLTLASLALCYSHAKKIEGKAPWSDGFFEFLGAWLASYFFMIMFFFAVAVVYIATSHILAVPDEPKHVVTDDESIVFFGVVVFVGSIVVAFVL